MILSLLVHALRIARAAIKDVKINHTVRSGNERNVNLFLLVREIRLKDTGVDTNTRW